MDTRNGEYVTMAVGKAKVTFEADASDLTDKLTQQVERALAKIDGILGKLPKSAQQEASQAGDAIGSEIQRGADKADKALDAVDGNGLTKVTKKAAEAGAQVASGITSGASKADAALGAINGSGLSRVAEKAAQAGAEVASSISSGASKADAALGTVSGSSLSRVGEMAANAGSSIASGISSGVAAAKNAMGSISGGAFTALGQRAAEVGSSIRRNIGEALESVKRDANELPSAFGHIGGAIAAIAGPAVVLKGGFDRLMNIQRAEIMFQSVGLSAEQTKNQMAKLTEQVTGTSVSLSDAAKYSAMFAQAGVQLGKPMDSAIQAFTALSSIAEGSGVDVGRVMQQISAQGKVTGEDMAQMADAGVNATKYLADSMGMSQAEVKKAISDGKVSFEDFVKAVNMGTGDLAKQMGQTLPAKLSNMKTALFNLGASIIEPFIPGITAAVEFGTAIVKWAVGPIKDFAKWMKSGSVTADIFAAALAGIGAAAVVGALIGTVNALGLLTKVWQALNLGFLFTPVGAVIAGITALVVAVALLWKHSEAFRNFWIGMWESVKNAVAPAVDFVKGLWDNLVSVIRGTPVDAASPLSKLIGADRVAGIQNTISTVKNAWSDVKNAVLNPEGFKSSGALVSLIGGDNANRVFDILTNFKGAASEAWDAIRGKDGDADSLTKMIGGPAAQTVISFYHVLGDTARSVWEGIKSLGHAFQDVAGAVLSAGWDALIAIFKAVWDVVAALAKALFDIGKALWPLLKPLLMVIGGVAVAAVFLLVGALRVLAFAFEGVAKVISWLTENVLSPLISVIGTVISWIAEKLGAAIGAFVEWVGGLIAGIIDFFTGFGDTLTAVWDGLKSGWDSIWQWLQISWDTYGQPVLDFIGNVFLFFIGTLILAWEGLKLAWDAVWQWLQSSWDTYGQPVVDWITMAFDSFVGWLKSGWDSIVWAWNGLWGWLGVVWQTIGQPVVDFIIGVWNGFVAILTAIWNGISSAWSWLWNGVASLYHAVVDPLVAFIQTAFQTMGNIVRGVMDGIKGAISAAGRAVSDFYSAYVSPMVNSVKNGFTSVLNTVRGWKDGILGALRGAGSWLVGVGRDLVQGMINGIGQMVGRLMSAVSNLASSAISRAKSALGIHSPSRVFAEIGRNVGQGMARGIESMNGAVGSATAGLAAVAVDSARPVAAQVPSVAPTVMATAAPVTSAVAPSVESPIATLAPPLMTQQAPAAFGEAATAMQATTANVLTPMFTGLGATTQWLGGVMTQQAQGVISPTWLSMAQNMLMTQSGVINPTMLAAGLSVTQFATMTWGQIAGPVKQALSYLITLLFWALNSGVNPVMSAMRNSLNWLVSGFVWAVNSIGSAWARLRELTASPVRFTIGTVFNNGLVGMWNSVSELIGTKKMAPYPLRFATGGFVSGPGGPTDDKIPALLSNGEYVLTAKAVNKIGVQNLNAMNSGAVSATPNSLRTSKQQEAMFQDRTFRQIASRYAGGGIVKGSPAWRDLLRGYNWARSRSGRPYVWGGSAHGAGGTDCSGFMSGIADVILGGDGRRRWATGNFPGDQRGAWARGLAAGFAVGIRNGGPGGGHTAGTIGGVEGMPAVNVESGGSPSRVKFGAGAVGATDSYFNQHWFLRTIAGGRFVPGMGSGVSMGEMIAEAIKPFRDRTQAALRSWAGKPGIINTLPGAVDKAMDSKARAMIDKKMAESSADPGGTGVQRWAPLVSQLLRLYGHPASWLGITLKRMNKESGGNPRAINNWDINAKRGDPSKGLMQVIGSTFAAHRDPRFPNDIWDPKANIAASMRYTMRTYGSLPAGYGRAGGYEHGGLMGVGQGIFHKTAFKPERVLSPEQTTSFDRLVDWLDGGITLPEVTSSRGTSDQYGQPRTTRQVIVTQNIVAADPQRAADEVEDRLMALM